MRNTLWLFIVASLCGAAWAEVPSAVAIRGARVVTVSGPVQERSTVTLRDGLIEAVGPDVAIPADAWVIEGAGLTVYPGLIDALSSWGIPKPEKPEASPRESGPPPKGPEDRPLTESWKRAADLASPADKRLEEARNAGFTTAVTFPTDGIFGGQGAVLNLAGERGGDMVVDPSVGQYVALVTSGSRRFPASLMGTIAYIKQVYLDAGQYRQAKAMYDADPAGLARPAYDRALEGVLASERVLLPAERATDVKRMLRLARELGQPVVLYGGEEGGKVAAVLADSGTPILVSLKWPERDKNADPQQEDPLRIIERRAEAPASPKALADAGVRWAFYSGGIEKPAEIAAAVRKALDAGLSRDDAIRALTLSVAEIYGVTDRLGSIEPGKIANLVVTDGDLFAEKTKIKEVFIDGMKFTPPEEPSKKEEGKEDAR